MWFDTGAGKFNRIEINDSSGNHLNVSCPSLQQERLFFVADPDGSGNVWSTGLDGQDLQKHTAHDFFDVRYLNGDRDGGLVYTVAGALWHLDLLKGKEEQLQCDFGLSNAHMARSLEASEWIDPGLQLRSESCMEGQLLSHLLCSCTSG